MERDPRWRSDERITAAKVKVLAVTAAPTTRKASSPTVTVISSNGFICCLSLSATPHNTRVRFARLSLIVDIIDKIRLSVPPGELGYDSRSDVPVDLRCGAHNGGRSSATPSQRVTPELAELAPPFSFQFRGGDCARIPGVARVSSHMDTNPQTPIGDLSGEETALGVPTREMVEKRAREIARLAERDPDQFTRADWEQARSELTGMKETGRPNDPREIADSLSERGSVPGEAGIRARRVLPEDEAVVDKRLAERGVEEAAHDQMVEAAKEDQKQEG